MAEIHRGGLISVAKGQHEAGYALGFSYLGIQRKVVIPQALRIALPALVNEFITIVKQTSLVSVISLPELLMTGQRLYAENFLVMETLAAVAVYYVLIVSVFSLLFQALERWANVQVKTPQTLHDNQLDALRQQAVPLAKRQAVEQHGTPDALLMKQIQKTWGQNPVFKDIDLRVAPGEVVSVIGPSGSGKTTLIRSINGLETLDSGEIVLFGESFIQAGDNRHSRLRKQGIRRIGMVFQGFNLFPHYTILQNVMLAQRYHQQPEQESARRAQALWLLDKVGLLAHMNKYPHQLSGGQQQRVAIARALAHDPAVVIADEPTGNLDMATGEAILELLLHINQQTKTTFIISTHSAQLKECARRVVEIKDGGLVYDSRA